MNCLLCDEVMDDVLVKQGIAFHPTCDNQDDTEAAELKTLVQKMIRYGDGNSARSLQKQIGPSEMGDACDRRVAYRLLETPEVNAAKDPWPAIVGTAVHWWMEAAVKTYEAAGAIKGWHTEISVHPDYIIKGHSDVYDARKHRVIDWKTAGTDVLRKIRAHGPPASYIYQANLYGLGHERAGRPVKDIALVFLPRAGWLSGIYVWRDIYRRHLAERMIERVYRIGDQLLSGTKPWEIKATPADACGYCPWFASGDTLMGIEPGVNGCPGRN
jgi:hypothetical protein